MSIQKLIIVSDHTFRYALVYCYPRFAQVGLSSVTVLFLFLEDPTDLFLSLRGVNEDGTGTAPEGLLAGTEKGAYILLRLS